jgi:hypothetical protein
MFLVLASVLCFHPSVRPRWDKSYREQLLSQFIIDVQVSKVVDAQKYWIFREKFSPGNFVFNDQAIDVFQTYRIVNLDPKGVTKLLTYSSPYLSSVDSVVPLTTESIKLIDSSGEKLLSTKEVLLVKNDNGSYQLNFLLPISEMKKANGFFDYLEKENELLKDQVWLNSTTIKY